MDNPNPARHIRVVASPDKGFLKVNAPVAKNIRPTERTAGEPVLKLSPKLTLDRYFEARMTVCIPTLKWLMKRTHGAEFRHDGSHRI